MRATRRWLLSSLKLSTWRMARGHGHRVQVPVATERRCLWPQSAGLFLFAGLLLFVSLPEALYSVHTVMMSSEFTRGCACALKLQCYWFAPVCNAILLNLESVSRVWFRPRSGPSSKKKNTFLLLLLTFLLLLLRQL